MIKLDEIKTIKIGNLFLITIIATHFGKNPNKGGKPPKDNKLIKIINFSFIFLIKVSWEK